MSVPLAPVPSVRQTRRSPQHPYAQKWQRHAPRFDDLINVDWEAEKPCRNGVP